MARRGNRRLSTDRQISAIHRANNFRCSAYESVINVSINWIWDGGIEVRVGDEVNGFEAEETFALMAGIGPWAQQAIAHFLPGLRLRPVTR